MTRPSLRLLSLFCCRTFHAKRFAMPVTYLSISRNIGRRWSVVPRAGPSGTLYWSLPQLRFLLLRRRYSASHGQHLCNALLDVCPRKSSPLLRRRCSSFETTFSVPGLCTLRPACHHSGRLNHLSHVFPALCFRSPRKTRRISTTFAPHMYATRKWDHSFNNNNVKPLLN